MTGMRADFWQEQGAADVLVRLMTTGLVRPAVSYAEVCRSVGVTDSAALDAVARYKALTRPPRRRRDADGPTPVGTKWCGFAQHFPPVRNFAPNRTSTTGYQSWCRGCMVLARRRERERKVVA